MLQRKPHHQKLPCSISKCFLIYSPSERQCIVDPWHYGIESPDRVGLQNHLTENEIPVEVHEEAARCETVIRGVFTHRPPRFGCVFNNIHLACGYGLHSYPFWNGCACTAMVVLALVLALCSISCSPHPSPPSSFVKRSRRVVLWSLQPVAARLKDSLSSKAFWVVSIPIRDAIQSP